jgi:hypothetical protein
MGDGKVNTPDEVGDERWRNQRHNVEKVDQNEMRK